MKINRKFNMNKGEFSAITVLGGIILLLIIMMVVTGFQFMGLDLGKNITSAKESQICPQIKYLTGCTSGSHDLPLHIEETCSAWGQTEAECIASCCQGYEEGEGYASRDYLCPDEQKSSRGESDVTEIVVTYSGGPSNKRKQTVDPAGPEMTCNVPGAPTGEGSCIITAVHGFQKTGHNCWYGTGCFKGIFEFHLESEDKDGNPIAVGKEDECISHIPTSGDYFDFYSDQNFLFSVPNGEDVDVWSVFKYVHDRGGIGGFLEDDDHETQSVCGGVEYILRDKVDFKDYELSFDYFYCCPATHIWKFDSTDGTHKCMPLGTQECQSPFYEDPDDGIEGDYYFGDTCNDLCDEYESRVGDDGSCYYGYLGHGIDPDTGLDSCIWANKDSDGCEDDEVCTRNGCKVAECSGTELDDPEDDNVAGMCADSTEPCYVGDHYWEGNKCFWDYLGYE